MRNHNVLTWLRVPNVKESPKKRSAFRCFPSILYQLSTTNCTRTKHSIDMLLRRFTRSSFLITSILFLTFLSLINIIVLSRIESDLQKFNAYESNYVDTNEERHKMNSFNDLKHSNILSKHMFLYRDVYDEFNRIRGNAIIYEEYFTNHTTDRISLSTYGPNILQYGCNITVQIMDPRISTSHRGAPAFFTLESVGAFIPDACVVITTSKCKIHLQHEHNTQMTVEDVLYHHIYNSSLPLFQAMIKRGQVRVKILDHEKYNLKSCDNFYNPSAAMMNINYWRDDQFLDGVDSDMVLIMQDDSALCNEPNLEYLRRFPYIGALWLEYECNLIKKLWRGFTRQPLKEYRDKEKAGLLSDQDRLPDLVNLTSTMDRYCDRTRGIGAVGNGGFSLRSRSAMMKVIETCPHVFWSGIDIKNRTFPCLVTDKVPEDLYFATVMRGLNMPMPTAYEAAVFSVERMWPSNAMNRFGGPRTYAQLVETTLNIMKHVHFTHVNGRFETVPLGFHQAHYYTKSLISEGDLTTFCPFYSFVFDPLDPRNGRYELTLWLYKWILYLIV